jgi:hypothetical protein
MKGGDLMSDDALHTTLPSAVPIRLHQNLTSILVSLLTCALGGAVFQGDLT